MNSKDRVITALNHKEPDRIPYDLGSTGNTGIHEIAYRRLLQHLGIKEEKVRIIVLLEQIADVSEECLQKLGVDFQGIYSKLPAEWNLEIKEDKKYKYYFDEFAIKWAMPKKEGLYYDMQSHPLSGSITLADIKNFPFPDYGDQTRARGLREEAKHMTERDVAIVMNMPYGGILETAEWVRGFKDFFLDLAGNSSLALSLLDKLTSMRIQYWNVILNAVGNLVQVVTESDDLGTQNGPLISPAMYREYIKPRHKKIFSFIKEKAPHIYIHFHSCGSVYDFIPDLIDAGIDILNPVQVSAAGMDSKRLKKEFGNELTFWGGGVDTQRILPRGTPNEVRDEVKRRIDDLAPGGGFVFNTVHNIQADVPPENIMAMWETLQEYGEYG